MVTSKFCNRKITLRKTSNLHNVYVCRFKSSEQKQLCHILFDGLVKGETSISVGGENLGNGVYIGGGPEIQAQIHLDGSAHDALGSSPHRIVETGVNDVLLAGSRHPRIELRTWVNWNGPSNSAKSLLKRLLHTLKQVEVGVPLILEGETTVGDMVEVFQPKLFNWQFKKFNIKNSSL